MIDVKKVKSDINGNSRYVFHYLNLLTEKEKHYHLNSGKTPSFRPFKRTTSYNYELALKRSRKIGGRKFHNKQYGGGIVVQAHSEDQVQELINTAMNGLDSW